MKKQSQPTLFIHLSGGSVESITTDVPARVVVLDYDAGKVGEGDVNISEGEDETESAAVLTPQLEVRPGRVTKLLSVVAEHI